MGVTAVPTFVSEGYALVGAHPYENFHKLMEAAGVRPRAA
jgi:predicted DsbA family dithiol-disulfide isomerase